MEEDNEYRVYRKFLSIVEAEPLLVFLKEKNIDYKIEHYTSNISTTFASTNNADQVEVKLQPNEFEVVDRLLEEDASSTIDSLPQDYYMLSFSDEELMEVLEKPDEWTQEDYILAIQLLKKHGKVLNDDMLHSMKQNRLAELRKPEHGSEAWNIAGYISAILGGFLGMFMGWYLMSSKKTLPNGESVYQYDTSTRLTGKRMLYLGLVFIVIWFIIVAINYGNRASS